MQHKYKAQYRGLTWALAIIMLAMTYGMVISCNRKQTAVYRQAITPPVPEADVPFDRYEISSDSGAVIMRPSGTRIRIPKGAFVDPSGKPVSGRVAFRVREFHGPTDVLRAGIPMSVDSTRTGFLQSAGMIEMRADVEGRPVDIGGGQRIDVELAGYRPADGYRLYQLENDRDWRTADTFSTAANEDKARLLDSLDQVRRYAHPDSLRYFNIDMQLENGSGVLTKRQRTWKLAMLENRRRFDQEMRVQWNRLYIKPIGRNGNRYRLEFRKNMDLIGGKRISRSYTVVASPVIARGEEARLAGDLKEYDALMRDLDRADSLARRQADLRNRFSVNRLGIWNIDRLLKTDDGMICRVKPDFASEDIPDLDKIDLMMVLETENSVIRFRRADWENIPLRQGQKVSMVAVLNHDDVAYFSSASIAAALAEGRSNLELKSERMTYAEYLKRNPAPGR